MCLLTIGLCAAGVGLLYLYLAWNNGYWSKRNVYDVGATLVAGSFPQAFLQRKNIVYEIDVQYRLVGIFNTERSSCAKSCGILQKTLRSKAIHWHLYQSHANPDAD